MKQKLAGLQAKLKADQSWAEKLFALETPEAVQSLLTEQGLEFSLEEIDTLKNALVKAVARHQSGELSDEDLKSVAGGTIGTDLDNIINDLGNFITAGRKQMVD